MIIAASRGSIRKDATNLGGTEKMLFSPQYIHYMRLGEESFLHSYVNISGFSIPEF